MPLQNRVDPFGEIHATSERGSFTGNRGIIHDPETRTLLNRRWATKAWITCALEFKGVRRVPMGRNRPGNKTGWTELFFLDEVTALAAGHRPCFYCRRQRAKAFAAAYAGAFGKEHTNVDEIDARLHRERLASRGQPVELDRHGLHLLPDGAMFSDGASDYAVRSGKALRWSFAGYDAALGFDDIADTDMCIVTPATTLAVLHQGYAPEWHPSAERLSAEAVP
ncbi:hypothetical protein EDC40_101805 [Aminobacter aminovorans]|uniref:Uncharacterized protein n=1 Tax=Aminobacter aminovorans TaxID=83263 RepID=A0A380WT56_AMIAI|nr:hypothetical protein [Aminobacter aminovorans]TCS30485.1 hypothetical protein EDC40_101805 [Aminobacter aminovorans]SUU91334.1 Uncharacterised protein [Aminobacter aminovorans]